MRRMRFLTWPVVPTLGAVALCVGALEGQSQDGAAASGRVAGRVVDASQGTPLAGVSVGIPGTSLQVYTGVDGRYLLVGVPAGSVDVVFRRIGYRVKRVVDLRLGAGGAVQVDAALEPQVVQLDEIVIVSAAAERGSVARALDEQRASPGLVNAVSIAQIERSPDAEAAQAAQRVSGVTVQDGKFIFMRGLGGRYTAATLDGVRIPSPEPERRDVPLDLFPTGLLDQITARKTFTPDQPGDFGGGQMDLRTRDFSLRRSFALSLALGANQSITGRRLLLPPSVGPEWLGFAGAARRLPAALEGGGTLAAVPPSQIGSVIGSFRNAWNAVPGTGPAAGSGSLWIGGEEGLLGLPLGYAASLTYSYGPEVRWDEHRSTPKPDGAGGASAKNTYDGITTRTSVLWGGLAHLNARLGAGSKLYANALYTRSGDNEATHLIASLEEFSQVPVFDLTRLSFTERALHSVQLRGEHLLMARHEVGWLVGAARVARSEPDRSDLAYEAQRDSLSGAIVPVRWWGAPRSATRTFSHLEETSRDLQVSLRLVSNSGPHPSAVKLGGAIRATRREADSRAYDVWNLSLDDAQRGAPAEAIFDGTYAAQGRLGLFESAIGGRYTATETVAAGFGQVETRVAAARLVAGLRLERARLEVHSLSPNGQPATGTLDNVDLLPGVSLTVPVATEHHLKLAFGTTVARPEYRELSPVSYYEVLGGATVFGNPGLRRTVVHNADLRWEWFPHTDEVVSVGLFAKRFADPIELILVATTGGLTRTYVNGRSAKSYGLEAEARRSLEMVNRRLASVYVMGNAAIVRSRIIPGNDSISALTNPDRAMVGQAAYVINAGMGYSPPGSDLSATILYNVVGPRIAEAGVYPMPDSYERPRHVVDVALRVPVTRAVAVKLDAKNLLDSPYRITQGALVRHAYRTGRTLTLGLRWSPETR
jgi:hypothetical protein